MEFADWKASDKTLGSTMAPLYTLYVTERLGRKATHKAIQEVVGKAYPTVHRHFRSLKVLLDVDIRPMRPGGNIVFYAVMNWGTLEPKSFMQRMEAYVEKSGIDHKVLDKILAQKD